MRVIKSYIFEQWYRKLDTREQILVEIRITRILIDSNFGVRKRIREISELKFKDGIRFYYHFDGNELVLLLNGGKKNTKRNQRKDIERANQIFQDYKDGK